MTYSQNLVKRRSENRKAKVKGENNPRAGTPIEGKKSKKFAARIAKRSAKRTARKVKEMKGKAK